MHMHVATVPTREFVASTIVWLSLQLAIVMAAGDRASRITFQDGSACAQHSILAA